MADSLKVKGSSKLKTRPAPAAGKPKLVEPFSVDEPRYLLGQVALAAGISPNLLKTWIAREVIVLGEHDRDAHGKGSSRVFTLRRALAVAATAEFVRLGMDTSMAGNNGKIEADYGDPLRVDDHLMVYYPLKDAYEVAPSLSSTSLRGLLKKPYMEEAPVSFIVFSRKALVERVLRRLGELEE
ncbi:MAG: hypothetical protein WA716_10510 [Pseudolabrys sp.]